LLDTECEDLTEVLETNLIGPFRLTKILAGAMAIRGAGTILHISSDAAVEPYPRWGAYGASKAAQDHLSRILAAELEGTGVRVLAVDPGEMDTAMHAAAIPEADRAALSPPAAVAARIVQMIEDDARAPSGSRLVASRWEVMP
jgi:NAD(P)-dependent dehydrogenase (short-subunit alcohol dehydrogenase family)